MGNIGCSLLLTSVLCFGLQTQADDANPSIASIIQSLKTQSEIYKNIEFELTVDYEDLRFPFPAVGNSNVISRSRTVVNCVRMGEKCRIDRIETTPATASPLKKEITLIGISAFDGTTARVFSRPSGHKGEKRVVQGPGLRPYLDGHNVLFTHSQGGPDLRTILSGSEALRPYSDGEECFVKSDLAHFVCLETEFETAPCDFVRFEYLKNGQPHKATELLLRKDRNRIPAWIYEYDLEMSSTVPIRLSRVKEWSQLAEGIWFPVLATIEAIDRGLFKTKGLEVPAWRRTLSFRRVSIKPSYLDEYFQAKDVDNEDYVVRVGESN